MGSSGQLHAIIIWWLTVINRREIRLVSCTYPQFHFLIQPEPHRFPSIHPLRRLVVESNLAFTTTQPAGIQLSPPAKICVPDKLHSLVQTHLSCSLLCMLLSIMLLISINILCLAWWRCKNGLHGFAYFAQFRLQFSKTHIPRLVCEWFLEVVACCELKSVAPKTSLLFALIANKFPWSQLQVTGANY